MELESIGTPAHIWRRVGALLWRERVKRISQRALICEDFKHRRTTLYSLASSCDRCTYHQSCTEACEEQFDVHTDCLYVSDVCACVCMRTRARMSARVGACV